MYINNNDVLKYLNLKNSIKNPKNFEIVDVIFNENMSNGTHKED